MATAKMIPNNKSVINFLDKIEDEQKKKDSWGLMQLMEEITKEEPIMWGDSIVGFGSYHYKYASGREGDWFLTGFSPRKKNLSIYIVSGFKKHETILKKLGKHKHSVSCLYINKLNDIDIQQLKKLIKNSVEIMRKADTNK